MLHLLLVWTITAFYLLAAAQPSALPVSSPSAATNRLRHVHGLHVRVYVRGGQIYTEYDNNDGHESATVTTPTDMLEDTSAATMRMPAKPAAAPLAVTAVPTLLLPAPTAVSASSEMQLVTGNSQTGEAEKTFEQPAAPNGGVQVAAAAAAGAVLLAGGAAYLMRTRTVAYPETFSAADVIVEDREIFQDVNIDMFT